MNIFTACIDGALERVRELVYNDKRLIDDKLSNGWTPLHAASFKGELAIVKFLVSKGADMKTSTEYGVTPLRIACDLGRLNVVIYLQKQPLRVVFLVLCHSRVFSIDLVRSLFLYFV
jgi:Ankyrin repeats (3 copies)